MLSSVKDGPCNFAGVLALHEQGLNLATKEEEGLAIDPHKAPAMAGVDFVPTEAAQLQPMIKNAESDSESRL